MTNYSPTQPRATDTADKTKKSLLGELNVVFVLPLLLFHPIPPSLSRWCASHSHGHVDGFSPRLACRFAARCRSMVRHLQYIPFLPVFLVLVRDGAVSAASLRSHIAAPSSPLPFCFSLSPLVHHPGTRAHCLSAKRWRHVRPRPHAQCISNAAAALPVCSAR
jgi:hypothetical protein